MKFWLLALWVLAAPCYGAQLRGQVLNEDGVPVPKARIMVIHDMALMVSQSANTDFNGSYHFNLEPGPYRVFVLKQEFRPLLAKVIILDEKETLTVDHVLNKYVSVGQTREDSARDVLKKALRRSNRDPLRSLAAPTFRTDAQVVQQEPLFGASLEAGSRKLLDGDVTQHSTIALQGRLHETVTLRSNVMAERNQEGDTARRLQADLALEMAPVSLSMSAEHIQALGRHTGVSEQAKLSGSYGHRIKAATAMHVVQSQLGQGDERSFGFSQNLQYELQGQHFSHEAEVVDWRRGDGSFARRSGFSTQWRSEKAAWLSLGGQMERLELQKAIPQVGRFWAGATTPKTDRIWHFHSRLGWFDSDKDGALLQQHQVSGRFGMLLLDAGFQADGGFEDFNSGDIFGQYLTDPTATHINEGFYVQRSDKWHFDLGIEHHNGWVSGFNWHQVSAHGDRLFTHQPVQFRAEAGHHSEQLGYRLSAPTNHLSLDLRYTAHRDDLSTEFSVTSLSYRQFLAPWRQGLGMMLELRVQNQPDLPAWWLLNELPWNPDDQNHWYQGQVGFQF